MPSVTYGHTVLKTLGKHLYSMFNPGQQLCPSERTSHNTHAHEIHPLSPSISKSASTGYYFQCPLSLLTNL